MTRYFAVKILMFGVAVLLFGDSVKAAGLFTPVDLQAFDEATLADTTRVAPTTFPGPLAIDGDTGTTSFLTNSGTLTPQIVAFDFGGSKLVDAIRVNKLSADIDGTQGAIDNMDLTILFTTDVGPLNARTYTAVSGLTNDVSEPITALSVNSATAMVDNDSSGPGIWRLNFNPVNATAIGFRIEREATDPVTGLFTHYPVVEFEVNEAVPEPSGCALALGSLALVGWRRRRR